MIIRKSKRHTEHFSRSTQNSISAHRRFTTPLICTKNARRKLTSVSLSWIKINNQVKCYCVWSFFERNVFCVHYWWGRERRKVFPTDCGSFHLPGNSRAIQTFSHLLLSRYISSSPCCQSAPVFNFHGSSYSCSSLTIDKMTANNRQNKHLKNPTFDTLKLPCTNYFKGFFMLSLTLAFELLLILNDIFSMTHKLGVSSSLSLKCGCMTRQT